MDPDSLERRDVAATDEAGPFVFRVPDFYISGLPELRRVRRAAAR